MSEKIEIVDIVNEDDEVEEIVPKDWNGEVEDEEDLMQWYCF